MNFATSQRPLSFSFYDIVNAEVPPGKSPTTADVHVICAWPLSGQYGPGARYLFYVLILACIFAVKFPSIKNSCLAAALLFPAVSAVHAICIAAQSDTGGTVDLDIYGTFQLISIGLLTVPITIRYSTTYFETKGRSLVFMWTILNLAGLLSLAVAFYRAQPHVCLQSDGSAASLSQFLNDSSICVERGAPVCSTRTNYIRRDRSNPAQYVLSPAKGMTINTAMLLTVACCIPGILGVLSVWQKVLYSNWEKIYPRSTHNTPSPITSLEDGLALHSIDADAKTPQEAQPTQEEIDWVANRERQVKLVLGFVERIVFTACVICIVILGEWNFWSPQMREGVEPIQSIGQWGPIVGAILATLGSVWTRLIDGPDMNEVAASQSGDPLPRSPATPTLTIPESEESQQKPGHREKIHAGLFRVIKAWGTPGADSFEKNIRTPTFNKYPTFPSEERKNEDLPKHEMQFELRQRVGSLLPRGASASDILAAYEGALLELELHSRKVEREESWDPSLYESSSTDESTLSSPGAGPSRARTPSDLGAVPADSQHSPPGLQVPKPRRYSRFETSLPGHHASSRGSRTQRLIVLTPLPSSEHGDDVSDIPMIIIEEASDSEC